MGLKAPENVKFAPQEALEDGNHEARVVRVVDLGTQSKPGWPKGADPKIGHIIRVTYELPYEFMKDEEGNELEDKPRWVDEEFFLRSLDSDLATSTARSKAIDPTGELRGDWSQYLGLPVVIQLETKGKYTNVKGATPMRKRDMDKLPELKNDALFFDLEDPSLEVFKILPQWLQANICQNLNFKGSKLYDLLDGKEVTWVKGQKKSDEKSENEAPENEGHQAKDKTPAKDAAPGQEDDVNQDVPW